MSDPSKIFCRDCLTYSSRTRERCQSCGSPRVLTHPERDNLSIAHIDCDAFYASVEKRDRPELRDKPLIIGGGKRGVVSTCCYIARIRGVHSAQPMFKALKACPEAVVIKPDMAKYVEVGREVRRRMQDLTPMVEPLSIDEAFLDLAGTERLHHGPAAETLARFANDIEKEIGITVSVGLSFNKFLAKVASDLEKPRGFSIIGKEEALSFLAEQPVSLIWGVGKTFQKKLASDGITHIRHLQKMDEATLGKAYGTMGLRLYHLARANDKRSVSPERETKSISSETTFNIDIKDAGELSVTLRSLAEKVSARLKKAELAGHTIVLKLKSADFKIRTRNHRLPDPTQLADKIFRISHELLLREIDGTAYRLLGVGVSDLYPADVADPADFLNDESEKRADAERAMDKVRAKFGKDAVNVGLIAKLAPPDDGEAE